MTTEIPAQVFDIVRRCVADSLAVEPEKIALTSRLVDDLGADSLDFVDIIFMLDRELDIRVRESEFNFLTRLDFSSPEVMREGRLTEATLARLRDWLPALRELPPDAPVTPGQLFSMITVETLAILVERRLASR